MDKKEWLEAREKGLGGSEAPAALGLSRWKTPFQVWKDKRGLSGERESSSAMEWGLLLEPVIRQRYSDVTGRTVKLPGHLRDSEHQWMLGTVDGITDDNRLLEIKTARSAVEWGEEGTDEIPQAYLIQVQHYLHITKLSVADIAVLFAGSDFRIYEVPADIELQNMIIEQEAAFWNLVETGIPPEPVSYADAVQRYKTSKEVQAVASEEIIKAVFGLRDYRSQMKIMEQTEENWKAFIMKELKEADTLISPDGDILLTWKQAKGSSKFDVKTFQEKEPELYKQYLKTTEGSRRFLLK